ncbi:MAG: hypothetical protein ACTJLK_02270 [Anaplasma sp.]
MEKVLSDDGARYYLHMMLIYHIVFGAARYHRYSSLRKRWDILRRATYNMVMYELYKGRIYVLEVEHRSL